MPSPFTTQLRRLSTAGAVALTLVATACSTQAQSAPATAGPPRVTAVEAVRRPVAVVSVFTGRVEPVERVELRARVGGALDAILFREGARVAAGTALFRIDRRPYAIALDRAKAEYAAIEAQLSRAREELARAERLASADAVAAEEVDRRRGEAAHLAARADAARAAVADAALQVEFTTVRAPVAGTIGRLEVTSGNLVTGGPGDGTRLAVLQSLDPIYVYFDVDPATAARAARSPRSVWRASVTPFEGGTPIAGPIDFVDAGVGPQTGTLKVRARLRNPEGRLQPSAVVRVTFQHGTTEEATVVPELAIGTDQGQRYVLVANPAGVVEYRSVDLGPKVRDWRVVTNRAVKPGDRVLLPGLPGLRAGITVHAEVEALR